MWRMGTALQRAARSCLAVALFAPLAACGEETLLLMATRESPPAVEVEAVVVTPEFVRLGEQLPISVRLLNRGAQPLTVPVIGAAQQAVIDVWLTAADGTRVWQLLPPGEPVPTTTTELTIAAGGLLSFTTVWDLRTRAGALVEPGMYLVEARVLTPSGAIVARPASVLISP